MRLRLDYGREGLDVDLPDGQVHAVLSQRPTEPLADLPAAVTRAIQQPIGTQPLASLAAGRRTACLVVCDITRPVPNAEVLPPILRTLEAEGIPREGITILIATGTHRPNLGEELEVFLGPEIPRTYRVENHVATDEHVWIGESPNGVPVWLNRTYVEADLRITCGMIEPHFMAGYAGGRKMVMPGVAALATVKDWHSPRFLEHPNATNGIVDGNPVHEESLAISRMCPPHFIVDVALDPRKQAYAVFAGELESAWRAGVEVVAANVCAEVPGPVDVVITTCGGFPLDLTYYQTVKGMVGALPILKPGGTIIVASECAEGVGNRHFHEALLALDRIDDFPHRIESGEWTFVPDQWQIEELARVVRHAGEVLLVSSLPPTVVEPLFARPMPSVESAVERALAHHGETATVVVIPKGPYVLPALA